MRTIIVGSRQSALALTQTNHVIEQLRRISEENNWNYEFELRRIVTKGDQILDVTLSKVGGKGLFVKEIEQAMLDGEIDFAVHSMKDMPAQLPEGLVIGAVPKREDPRDCLITQGNIPFTQLPHGARVGTSSLRRSAQLRHARADLQISWIRGNIDTRIRKLEEEGYHAVVLAAAGLRRMGWESRISDLLSTELCIPAVGQGALGIECRIDDEDVRRLLQAFNDADTERTVQAERAFLLRLNGGCQVPIGAYAEIIDRSQAQPLLKLTGMVGSAEGDKLLKVVREGMDAVQLGIAAAEALIAEGAEEILADSRG